MHNYPVMMENPQFRWEFIRKVYSILTLQIILTCTLFVLPFPNFLLETTPGIILIIVPLSLLCPLHVFRKRHPLNLFLLTLFTVAIAFALRVSCPLCEGRIVLEAGYVTSTMFVGSTLFTFWAAYKGGDCSFLGRFLFNYLVIITIFLGIQIFIPLGKWNMVKQGRIAALIFCFFMVHDTENLIKLFNYDDYILAAVVLYLDITTLFISVLAAMNVINYKSWILHILYRGCARLPL